MHVNPLSNSEAYLQSLQANAVGGSGSSGSTHSASSTNSATGTSSSTGASSLNLPTDSQQLSPFAQAMSTLQQLQQQNPAEYQQVTQQIATNLQSAAQTDQAQGNTAAATQLNAIAAVFQNASASGQMPSISGLAQAMGGHHHHHHASSADSYASTSGGTQSDALSPMSIITSTISSAGLGGASS